METQLKEKQDVSATFTVKVPAPVVDATFDRVLSDLSRKVRVPGFRPGRAPRGVLVQRIGRDALAEEVRETLVDEHYPQAVRELELMPVHAHFHGEPPVEGADYTFEVHADLYPTFELPDLDSIELDSPASEPSEEDVERTIERLREEHATLVPVERPIEAGDVLTLESLGDDSGGSMPVDLTRTEDHIVEQLTGKAIGDEVDLDLGPESEAEESPRRSLAVRVSDVKAKELPDPDDAFAATLGFDSWEATLAEIRKSLAAQVDREAFKAQRDEFVDKLVGAIDMALPRSLVTRRQRALLEELSEDLQRQRNQSLQDYLSELEERGSRSEFEDDLKQAAERAVKRDLVLEALLERDGERMSDEDFESALAMMAASERKDVKRFRSEKGEEWLGNYRFLLDRDRALRKVVAAKTGREL